MAMTETEVIQNETTAIEVYDSPQEMARKLASMKQMLTLTQKFFQEVMVPDNDYGIIPGTGKPTLLKPGAEKLSEFYGYAPTIRQIDEEKDIQTGFYRARVIISLVHKKTGTIIADGVGEANTFESRYRYRWVPDWKLPKGIDKNSLYCEERQKKNGETYLLYRIENDDLWTLWNTVLKMAKKRALVDAVLSATRSSGLFTQDAEDLREWVNSEQDYIPNSQQYQSSQQRQTGAPTNTSNGKTLSGMSTPAQQKKIHADAKAKGYRVDTLIRERFGIESGSTKDLTKQQASELITWLMEAPPAQAEGQQTIIPEREPGMDDEIPMPEPPPF